MKLFDKTTVARKPRTKETQQIAYMYVFVVIVFALCQLFNFNEFLTLIGSFWLPGGETTARLVGSLVVVSEVFSLPFLLRLNLTPLMRNISMVLSWWVPVFWLGLSLWVVLTVNAVSNIGFLGTTLTLVPGWWAVFVSVALGTMAAWVSWGMWPITTRHGK